MGKRIISTPNPATVLAVGPWVLMGSVAYLFVVYFFGFSLMGYVKTVALFPFFTAAVYVAVVHFWNKRLAQKRLQLAPIAKQKKFNAVIIGGGYGGIGAAIKLGEMGVTDITILDKNPEFGGTWYENTFPNAACDVAAHAYSFSFEPNPNWSAKFAPQKEILAYIQGVAHKYGLDKYARFNSKVVGCHFNRETNMWEITYKDAAGKKSYIFANILISAVGQLNIPKYPNIPGIDEYKGKLVHSSRWDSSYDFSGKRSGVIGTGPTAIQTVPAVVEQSEKTTVFLRSIAWIVDREQWSYPSWLQTVFDKFSPIRYIYRWTISHIFGELIWSIAVTGSLKTANEQMKEECVRKIQQELAAKPELWPYVIPKDPVLCKRGLISDDFLPALESPKCDVETNGIERFTPKGIRTVDGKEIELDNVILCTGFRSTEFLSSLESVTTGHGKKPDAPPLREVWKEDGSESAAYFGITVQDFPNLFIIYGPHTNRADNNIIYMLECQQNYIAGCVEKLLLHPSPAPAMSIKPAVMEAFEKEVSKAMESLVFTNNCNSWYKVGPKGRVVNNCHIRSTSYWLRTLFVKEDEYIFTGAAGRK